MKIDYLPEDVEYNIIEQRIIDINSADIMRYRFASDKKWYEEIEEEDEIKSKLKTEKDFKSLNYGEDFQLFKDKNDPNILWVMGKNKVSDSSNEEYEDEGYEFDEDLEEDLEEEEEEEEEYEDEEEYEEEEEYEPEEREKEIVGMLYKDKVTSMWYVYEMFYPNPIGKWKNSEDAAKHLIMNTKS